MNKRRRTLDKIRSREDKKNRRKKIKEAIFWSEYKKRVDAIDVTKIKVVDFGGNLNENSADISDIFGSINRACRENNLSNETSHMIYDKVEKLSRSVKLSIAKMVEDNNRYDEPIGQVYDVIAKMNS